ncbi:uncharacterized protein SPAPADRAFT_48467 [Spathaspora passalidarum NRRL Y-27907]|uniref:SRPBCC domain-containing protein n=1 Tax=Spathaspora passalidarum (strain NRRL Y-27907 / 11-Y1) TaxID=619300 RepID=G3AH46_SPAPN|nr:uncharacterized protein SPAPADRAFT_48467 [Spathaspora passalidarum NRRL Y-27907]EGW35477.1 hypothetical protein SPAPADRAFT_48467 [Spathaspora passalidarum NRRL Y-27907]
MTTKLETSIEINAPVFKVRNFILNYSNHCNWNPFFVSFEKLTNKNRKELAIGDQLKIEVVYHGTSKVMTIYPTVIVNNFEQLKWKGILGFEWLFYGVHTLKYESLEHGTRTRLIHTEEFGGCLATLFTWLGITEKTELSFNDMNEALKDEIESLE